MEGNYIMKEYFVRPELSEVTLNDTFWTPYTEKIRDILIPYCFDKFEETGYIKNFRAVSENSGEKHIGPPFSDGLFLEMITGASDFLSKSYDEKLDKKLDELIDIVISAQQDDGYLTTIVCQDYSYKLKLAEICANPKVEADRGRVCVMYGPHLMCAEGVDNNGEVDFVLAENPEYYVKQGSICAKTADGREVVLIPYYKRNNRVSEKTDDSKMAVWFVKSNMEDSMKVTDENLYGYYRKYELY